MYHSCGFDFWYSPFTLLLIFVSFFFSFHVFIDLAFEVVDFTSNSLKWKNTLIPPPL